MWKVSPRALYQSGPKRRAKHTQLYYLSDSYTAKRRRIPTIGIIETTLHLRPVVSIGVVVSWPRQTFSDLTSPPLIAVHPVAACEVEFLLRSKRNVTGPQRKTSCFIASSDTWFYHRALRSTFEESAGCDSQDRTGVLSRMTTRGNVQYCYPEALPSLLEFTVTHLPRGEAFHSRLQKKKIFVSQIIQSVPLATEPGISLIILSPMRILQRNWRRTYLIV